MHRLYLRSSFQDTLSFLGMEVSEDQLWPSERQAPKTTPMLALENSRAEQSPRHMRMIGPQAPIALSVLLIISTTPQKTLPATRALDGAKARVIQDSSEQVLVLALIIAKVTAKYRWSRTSTGGWSSREVKDSLMIATATSRFPTSMGMPQVGPTRHTPRSYRAWSSKVCKASTCQRMLRLYRSRKRQIGASKWSMRSERTVSTLLAMRSRTWKLVLLLLSVAEAWRPTLRLISLCSRLIKASAKC